MKTMPNTMAKGIYKLKDVPNGEYVMKVKGSNKVYQRGAFDRSLGKYEITDVEDVNRTIFWKGDTEVIAGFTY